jgi:hypothetical protein
MKQADRALRSCLKAVKNAALAPFHVASVIFDGKDLDNQNQTSIFGPGSNSAANSNAGQGDISFSSTPPIMTVDDRSTSNSSSSSRSRSNSTQFGSFSSPRSGSDRSIYTNRTVQEILNAKKEDPSNQVDTISSTTEEVEKRVEQAQSRQPKTSMDLWDALNPNKQVGPTSSNSTRSSSRRDSPPSRKRTPSPPGILKSTSPGERSRKSGSSSSGPSNSSRSVRFGPNETRPI